MRALDHWRIGLCLIVVVLSSCNRITPISSVLLTETAYPAPSVEVEPNPYPLETPDYSTLFQDVTPDPSKGHVTGKILYREKPLVYSNLFLADVLVDQETGMEISTALDRSVAPHTITNENGEFIFSNVVPGRYGLILSVGTEIYLLLYPDTGLGVLLTVDVGAVDLGVLEYADLPLD